MQRDELGTILRELLGMRLALKPMPLNDDSETFISLDRVLSNPLVAGRTLELLNEALDEVGLRLQMIAGSTEHREALAGAHEDLSEIVAKVEGSEQTPLQICRNVLPRVCAILGFMLEAQEAASKKLKNALSVRRAYAAFQASLRSAELSIEDPVERLQFALAGLEQFLDGPSFPGVRTQDRLALELMLESCSSGRLAPEHAWEALKAFAAELRFINMRREIREHDTAVLEKLQMALSEQRPNGREVHNYCNSLMGMDDGLDEAIDHWIDTPSDQARDTLAQVVNMLARQQAAAA